MVTMTQNQENLRDGSDRITPFNLLNRGAGPVSTVLGVATTALYVVGALLVLWSGYIHFHLWNETDGYRKIATIGPLFLAQAIGGLVVALLIVAVRRVWAAIIGIGFAASTAVGFLLTVGLAKGLFNFKESWAAPFAGLAFAVEIAAIAVLLVAAALSLVRSASKTRSGSAPIGAPSRAHS
jgi:hypothetical protein